MQAPLKKNRERENMKTNIKLLQVLVEHLPTTRDGIDNFYRPIC